MTFVRQVFLKCQLKSLLYFSNLYCALGLLLTFCNIRILLKIAVNRLIMNCVHILGLSDENI